MKGIILHDHEVRQLSATGKVLVIRPVKTNQKEIDNLGDGESLWDGDKAIKNPFPTGTQFFVKEVWRTINDPVTCIGDALDLEYKAMDVVRIGDMIGTLKWKPANIMPFWASRFTVEIESVECKRVQEIPPNDVICAGLVYGYHKNEHVGKLPVSSFDRKAYFDLRTLFAIAWNRQHPKHPWHSNPFCWFVPLKRV